MDRHSEHVVHVPAGPVTLEGNLSLPPDARGLVLFAHGSGSSRHSPRNRYVAARLNEANLATFLVDLLTAEEERIDQVTAELRFNIGLLADRLVGVTDWLGASPDTSGLRLGYFGASTGAGAALVAAAERPDQAAAVVSRGGRPRSRSARPAARPGADLARRRRRGHASDRTQPLGAGGAPLREGARHRPWRDTSVRGARRPGRSRGSRYSMVLAPSDFGQIGIDVLTAGAWITSPGIICVLNAL